MASPPTCGRSRTKRSGRFPRWTSRPSPRRDGRDVPQPLSTTGSQPPAHLLAGGWLRGLLRPARLRGRLPVLPLHPPGAASGLPPHVSVVRHRAVAGGAGARVVQIGRASCREGVEVSVVGGAARGTVE